MLNFANAVAVLPFHYVSGGGGGGECRWGEGSSFRILFSSRTAMKESSEKLENFFRLFAIALHFSSFEILETFSLTSLVEKFKGLFFCCMATTKDETRQVAG